MANTLVLFANGTTPILFARNSDGDVVRLKEHNDFRYGKSYTQYPVQLEYNGITVTGISLLFGAIKHAVKMVFNAQQMERFNNWYVATM